MIPDTRRALLRDLCAALAEYDLATLHLLLAPEVVCHLVEPCKSADYQGVGEVVRLWTDLAHHAQGPAAQVEDVLSGDRYAALLCSTAHARGVVVVNVEEGRVAEVWLYGVSSKDAGR